MNPLSSVPDISESSAGACAPAPASPPPSARRPRLAPDGDYDGGWLCPTKADLARLTDMNPAVRRARLLAGLFCGLGVLVMAPWIGWLPLAVFGLAPIPLLTLDRLLNRAARPERVIAASLLLHTTLILTGVALTGGVHSPLLPWVAIPVVTAAARFRLPVFPDRRGAGHRHSRPRDGARLTARVAARPDPGDRDHRPARGPGGGPAAAAQRRAAVAARCRPRSAQPAGAAKRSGRNRVAYVPTVFSERPLLTDDVVALPV